MHCRSCPVGDQKWNSTSLSRHPELSGKGRKNPEVTEKQWVFLGSPKWAESGVAAALWRKNCQQIQIDVGGGLARNRTGVHGFAVRCVTTPPRGHPKTRPAGPDVRRTAALTEAAGAGNRRLPLRIGLSPPDLPNLGSRWRLPCHSARSYKRLTYR